MRIVLLLTVLSLPLLLLAQTATLVDHNDSIVTGSPDFGTATANHISIATTSAVGDFVVAAAWCDDNQTNNATVGGCTPLGVTFGSNASLTQTTVSMNKSPVNPVTTDAGTGQGFLYYGPVTAANQTLNFSGVETRQYQISYMVFRPSAGFRFVHNSSMDAAVGAGQTGLANLPSYTLTSANAPAVIVAFTACSTHCTDPVGATWTTATWTNGSHFLQMSVNSFAYKLNAAAGTYTNSVTVLNGCPSGCSPTWQGLISSFQLTNCPAGVPAGVSNCFFVSKSTGSDANTSAQAQSESTPWAHLPGMSGATGNAASFIPSAGEGFILKGCDVWVNADLPESWGDWEGTVSSPIYVGVDKTWFNTTNCPTSWNRPIFDGQNLAMPVSVGHGNSMFVVAAPADTPAATAFHLTIDNIEMKRIGGNGLTYLDQFGLGTDITFENMYLHAWDAPADNCIIVQAKTGNNNLFDHGVIDGSDSTGAAADSSCYGFYSTPPSVTNSVIHDVVNGIVGDVSLEYPSVPIVWSGNNVYNIVTSHLNASHCNILEIVGGGTYYVHDNVLHDLNCPGGASFFDGNTGETSYIWNNIFYNLNAGQTPSIPQGCAGGTINAIHFWNNTIVKSADGQSCINDSNQPTCTITTFDIRNNHCINVGGLVVDAFTGFTITNNIQSNNLRQDPTTADANISPKFDQYTNTETFAYSPVASTNSTVGAGVNLSSQCTGNNSGLCSDTSYACTQQTVGGVVQSVCPTRTATARPTTWDVGAYQFTGSVSSFSLNVSNSALGTTVSNDGAINCGATCSANYTSGSVTLTASIAFSGVVLTGWTVDGSNTICPGRETCTVNMTANHSVTANFVLSPHAPAKPAFSFR